MALPKTLRLKTDPKAKPKIIDGKSYNALAAVNDEDFARELVRRWNCHEEMVNASKPILRDIDELEKLTRRIDLTCHPDARNLVAALTAVIRQAVSHAEPLRLATA